MIDVGGLKWFPGSSGFITFQKVTAFGIPIVLIYILSYIYISYILSL